MVCYNNLVALNISEYAPVINTKITSAGFPAISRLGEADMVSLSINQGVISKIADVQNSKYDTIEISVNLSGGYSGGPCIDNKLNIQGLNAWGIMHEGNSSSWMVSSEVLQEWTEGIQIGQNETSELFMAGLQALQQKQGKLAEEYFLKVKQRNADIANINHLISLASSMKEEEPNPSNDDVGFIVYVILFGIPILLILGVISVIRAISKKIKKGKKNHTNKNNSNVGFNDYDFTKQQNNNDISQIDSNIKGYDFDDDNPFDDFL